MRFRPDFDDRKKFLFLTQPKCDPDVAISMELHTKPWVAMDDAPSPRGDLALHHWKSSLVDYVRSGEPDLTNRQMALLMIIYLETGPHTVRGLAGTLNVSKPVVTRALNRLGWLGYLRRERDERDRRNVYVRRTAEGAKFLEEFAQFIDTRSAVPVFFASA